MTANNDKNTVNIDIDQIRKQYNIPPHVNIDQIIKGFNSYNKNADYTKRRDRAVRNALTKLKNAHGPEYKKYLAVELTKEGLPVK